MDKDKMAKALFYTFLGIFVVTAALTLASLPTNGIPIGEGYKKALFGTLILEIVGCMIAFFKLSFLKQKKPINPENTNNQYPAYGLEIKKIIWKHNYLENGNFEGEIEYFIKNISNINLVDLPPYKAFWFGRDVKCLHRLVNYSDDNSFSTIDEHYFVEIEATKDTQDGCEREGTLYAWQFKVNPYIVPKKSLHFGIKFTTEGTEKAAFAKKEGSFAGMSSPFPVNTMDCEINSPKGYRFEKRGFIVRDCSGGEVKNRWGSPEFTDDGSKITWTVENPIPTLQYLIKVVIVKRD